MQHQVEWLISDGDQWISIMKTKTWFKIIMWIKLHLIDHKILDGYVQLFRLSMCFMDKRCSFFLGSWFYMIRRLLIFGRKIINIRLKLVLLNVLELRYLEFTLLYISANLWRENEVFCNARSKTLRLNIRSARFALLLQDGQRNKGRNVENDTKTTENGFE